MLGSRDLCHCPIAMCTHLVANVLATNAQLQVVVWTLSLFFGHHSLCRSWPRSHLIRDPTAIDALLLEVDVGTSSESAEGHRVHADAVDLVTLLGPRNTSLYVSRRLSDWRLQCTQTRRYIMRSALVVHEAVRSIDTD